MRAWKRSERERTLFFRQILTESARTRASGCPSSSFLSKVQFIFKYFYMTIIMDSSISYEKSSNSLHSFLQQHHQHVQQQQQHQQHLRLNVQHQQHHQQQHHQQQLEDNSEKLHSDQSDQENQQSDSCLFSRLQSCTDQNGQFESHLPPFVSCTNPHGIDTILNRRGLVSVAGGSAGNTCTVADTLAAAAACSLQQSAISRYPN